MADFPWFSVSQARQEQAIGKQVEVRGWVRTRRDSKGGFSFLEINDGSCLGNIQAIADQSLPNYESEILQLSVGSSIKVAGEVVASQGGKQATELKASSVVVTGHADPQEYPLQKNDTRWRNCVNGLTFARAPTPSRPSPAFAIGSASRPISSSRRTVSSTSTPPSSPPATARGQDRCFG
jgi:aspartyl/asparaginyl-tRNA synthetase